MAKPSPSQHLQKINFTWGHATIYVEITDGYFNSVQMHTDAMNEKLADIVSDALIGCQASADAALCALSAHLPEQIARDIHALLLKFL